MSTIDLANTQKICYNKRKTVYMLRLFLWRLLCLPFVASCVMLSGKRTAVTNISSDPQGAAVYAVHDSHIHDLTYEDKPKSKNKDGKTISFQGFTPLAVVAPKGMNTKMIVYKEGYKPTEFYVRGKREAVYYDGQNKECARDRYWSWLWSAGIVDEIINGYLLKDIKTNYCKDIRHSYHIYLED